MRSALLILVVLGFFSLSSDAFAQINQSAEGEIVTSATVLFPDTEIQLESASGESVPVKAHIVRALKIIPADGGNMAGVRACGVSGCLPEHEVLVTATKGAVVKLDIELTNTLAPTADPQRGNAYFTSDKARFNVDGTIMAPVLELKAQANGRINEQAVDFYIEPQQKVLQTLFMRVPSESSSVILLYGKNMSEPAASLQVCFSSCQGQPMTVKNVEAVTVSDTAMAPVAESNCQVNGKSVPCEEVVEKVGMFAKMGLGIIFGLMVFGAFATLFWVLMLIHAAKHQIENKAIWIGVMVVFGIFAAIPYYFVVKRPFNAIERAAPAPVIPPSGPASIAPPAPPVPPAPIG